MFERIRQMVVKEFIQMLRDRRMKVLIFLAPVIQLVVIGYAVSTDVKHISTAVFDCDNTARSRDLVASFVSSGYFDVVERVDDEARARELMDRGSVSAIIRMDKGFQEALDAGRTAPVQVIVDGTDSNTAGIVLDYSERMAGQFSRNVLATRLERVFGPARIRGEVSLESRAWFNENLESRNFFVPGVIAMLVTLVTLLLTSMAIVREKEIGTMEQIMVSPIRPWELILGKTLPFALVGLVDVAIVTTVGVLVFRVPIRGSLPLLFLCTLLFLVTTLGIGLLISTVSKTLQEAMMSFFLFNMPAVLLSGFVFPIANMPKVIQWVTYLNPLRHFLVIVRGIFLKGVGPEVLWPQMAALAAIGAFTAWAAASRFRKTMA